MRQKLLEFDRPAQVSVRKPKRRRRRPKPQDLIKDAPVYGPWASCFALLPAEVEQAKRLEQTIMPPIGEYARAMDWGPSSAT
jgi:hypothetical protein